MTAAALVTLLIYILVICLVAYVVTVLLAKGGINGTVRTIVYGIAALLVLVVLLNMIGVVSVPLVDTN